MKGYATVRVVLLALALLVPVGCRVSGSGAAALPTSGGGGVGEDGGTNGEGETDTGGSGGTGGTGDGDQGGGGGTSDGGDAGTDGAGPGPGVGAVPPTVTLFASAVTALPQDLILLRCSVDDDGGLQVTSFSFSSSAGSAEIQQDGSATATALVPLSLSFVSYTCRGTSPAGTGPDSAPVLVTVTGG